MAVVMIRNYLYFILFISLLGVKIVYCMVIQNGVDLQVINGVNRARVKYFQQTAFMMAQERLGLTSSNKVNHFESPAFSMAFMEELERLQDNFDSLDNANHKLISAIIVDTNSLIGYVDLKNLLYSQDGLPPGPYISDVVVNKSYRRQGLATSLLNECYSICINNWNEYQVHLKCEPSNLNALYLYISHGFIPVFLEKTIRNAENHNEEEVCIVDFETLHMEYYYKTINPFINTSNNEENKYSSSSFDLKALRDAFLDEYFLKFIQTYDRMVMKKILLPPS